MELRKSPQTDSRWRRRRYAQSKWQYQITKDTLYEVSKCLETWTALVAFLCFVGYILKEILMGGNSSIGPIRRHASSYEYGGSSSSSSWDNNSNNNYGWYPQQSPCPQQNPYQTPQHHLASASAPFYDY